MQCTIFIMKNNRYLLKKIKKIIVITLAAIAYGMGVSLFLDPCNLVPGGATGIAMILNRMTGIETGTFVFIINIPLLLIGIWKFGLRFLLTTMYAIVISSISINALSLLNGLTNDLFLASIAGGGLIALSLGTIFKAGATTGGTDIIVRLIKKKYKHIKTGRLFLIIDTAIVLIYVVIYGNVDVGLYSALTVITCSIILDMVLYGKDEAKLLYIITKSEEVENELVRKLLDELEVGVTYLKGYGAYKNVEKRVIMCAIRKQQLPKAKEIVEEVDDASFMIITSANEILGEGYKNYGGGL